MNLDCWAINLIMASFIVLVSALHFQHCHQQTSQPILIIGHIFKERLHSVKTHTGAPGWLTWLSVCLRITSWSRGRGIEAPSPGPCSVGSLCLPVLCPFPYMCTCACSLSLSCSLLNNKIFKTILYLYKTHSFQSTCIYFLDANIPALKTHKIVIISENYIRHRGTISLIHMPSSLHAEAQHFTC